MLKRRCPELGALALVGALFLSCSKSPGEASSGPTKPTTGGNGNSAGSGGGVGNTGGSATPVPGAGSASGGSSGASAGASGGGGGGGGGGSGAAGGGPWTFPTGVTKPRLMIVGDSISAGPGCYKKYLLQSLNDNGYKNFEFVGEYTDDCGGGVKHSAVSCSTAEQYTQPTFMMPNCAQDTTFPGMSTLVTTHTPDVIMMQLGVNDVWGGKAVNVILGNYEKLIEQARAQNPNVVLVVARIHKIAPTCMANDPVTTLAESLVQAVPAWAEGLSTATSPVFTADLWTNSDWSKAETSDCVHPNEVGAQRMGTNWYDALKGILKPN